MGKSLRFLGQSELRSLKAEGEMSPNGGDGELMITFNMSVLIPKPLVGKVIKQFFEDAETVKHLRNLLWREGVEVREIGIGSFRVKGAYGGQRLIMRTSHVSHDESCLIDECDVKNIALLPHPLHSISVRFEVRAAVSPAQWAWLRSPLVHGAIYLEFLSPTQMDWTDDLAHNTTGPTVDDIEDPKTTKRNAALSEQLKRLTEEELPVEH